MLKAITKSWKTTSAAIAAGATAIGAALVQGFTSKADVTFDFAAVDWVPLCVTLALSIGFIVARDSDVRSEDAIGTGDGK